ncbi:hypothetical protein R1sor_013987 [Riccia sorocarpa]|uniref:Secreted protein n=1 Tax=Riccia sorocarpa TaxID=122646 RepID=A0ABD3H850_9MARC
MELRYVVLSLLVILSIIVHGAAARPLADSKTEDPPMSTKDSKVDSSAKVDVSLPKSVAADLDTSKEAVVVPDTYAAGVSLEHADLETVERLLAAEDYGPISNENPKHGP